MALFYRQPGVSSLKHPPRVGIPEHKSPDEVVGSPSLSQPDPPSSVEYMGETFPHICRFWYILHDLSLVYAGDCKLPWGSGGSLAFAEFKFRELLAWSNGLPSRLCQSCHNSHHVQILQ